jgi:hypothetical protein
MSSNPRGFRGRGNGGRNTTQARQVMPTVPVSFAKRMRSPQERLLQRFLELGPIAVRITRYIGGSELEEIALKSDVKDDGTLQWITAIAGEERLSSILDRKAKLRAISRSAIRLGKVVSEKEFDALSQRERCICYMSQQEYNAYSFRASKEAQTGTGVPEGSPKEDSDQE